MTFKIEWSLDESDGLVQESLLGDITLRDSNRSIEERSVYVDSWLDSIIRGAESVRTINGDVKVDIPEESQPLLMHREPDGRIAVSFKGSAVYADSISELTSELRNASRSFVEKIKGLKDIEKNALFSSVRVFSEFQDPGA